MDEHTYILQCNGIERACRMIIRFVNDADVYLPECALFGTDGSVRMVPADATASTEKLMTFVQAQSNTITILCTAATDKQDKNRVVLAYTVGLDFMTLSFPMAQGQLSGIEQGILNRMSTVI